MTDFAMLSYWGQCILGAAGAFITAALLYLLVNAWMEGLWRMAGEVSLLFAVSMCLLQGMTEEMSVYAIRIESADASVPSERRLVQVRKLFSPILERIPVFWLIIFLLLLLCSVVFLRKRFQREKKDHMTPGVIKENMDHMPVGICYGAADGLPLLVNAQMDRLSASLFGTEILNANRFWNDLKTAADPSEVHLPDGTIWDFRRTRLGDEDGRWEILAYDITEQYQLGRELKEDSRRQRELNERLHKFNQEINLVTREDEILRAKIRIHDEIGHALMSYRLYQSQSPENRYPREMLALWDYIVRVLRREAEESGESADTFWQEFQKKAKALHVQVILRGEVPESPFGETSPAVSAAGETQASYLSGASDTAASFREEEETEQADAISLLERLAEKREPEENVLCVALQECLTNTVKHGRGNTLYVCARETFTEKESDRVEIAVYNNGVPPKGEIRETGGLGNLRRLAAQQGVEMHIESSPVFLLRLSFQM